MPSRLNDMLHLPTISALFGAMAATGVVVDEHALIPIGTMGAIGCIIWWVGRKLQSIDDRIEFIGRQANRMERVANRIEALPCMNNETKIDCDRSEKPLKMM